MRNDISFLQPYAPFSFGRTRTNTPNFYVDTKPFFTTDLYVRSKMRLINVKTMELQEFFGDAIPKYAILSHRWETEEVTFQNFQSGKGEHMEGWKKIIGCCEQARIDGLEYAWVDTCCIDKSSSAELSEAINSMFGWYQAARVCYAYLSDVPGSNLDDKSIERAFQSSKWFTRGWTLQELLAPDHLVFYDTAWAKIGGRENLAKLVKSITGIHHLFAFHRASVAQKMSWASRRQTTRVEDQAYCLLGLFGVNMPPLYGEGQRAFLRLQLEIMKMSNDESLFAWKHKLDINTGLLALTPASFEDSGKYVSVNPQYIPRPPFSMTNKGLQIELIFAGVNDTTNIFLAPLNCVHEDHRSQLISLFLKGQDGRVEDFQRLPKQLEYCPKSRLQDPGLKSRTVYLKQHELSPGTDTKSYFVVSLTEKTYSYGFEFQKTYFSNSSRGDYVKVSQIHELWLFRDNSALIELANKSESFVLKLRIDGEGQGFLHLVCNQKISEGNHQYLDSRKAGRLLDHPASMLKVRECAPPEQFSVQWSRIRAPLLNSGGNLRVDMGIEDDYGRQVFVVKVQVDR